MSDASHYHPNNNNNPSPVWHVADWIVGAELFWPLPLVAVGVLGALDPLPVGVAIILALIPWGARVLVFGRPTRPTFIAGALLLFVIGAFVSTWASYDPAQSGPLLLTLLGSVSLFFAIANTAVSPRRVAGWLVIVAGLAALYFTGQYAYFDYPTEVGRLADWGRLIGSLFPNIVFFTPHPNAVAGFLEGTFLLSLVFVRQARDRQRLAWGLVSFFIAYGLLISGSRGSWAGLVVALGIWGLLLLPNRTSRLVAGGLSLAAVALGIFFAARLSLPGIQAPVLAPVLDTAGSRFALYRNSLYLWGDYPFTGIGLGDVFAHVYSQYQLLISVPYLTYTHNLVLAVGLGLGLLGVAALIWLLVSFYRFVIRVEQAGLAGPSLPLFRSAWLGVTLIFLHGLTDAPQFSAPGWTMPMLFALLGVVITLGRPAILLTAGSKINTTAPARRRLWLTLSACALLVIVAFVYRRPLVSSWYANAGAIYQTRADLSPHLADEAREAAAARAVVNFERALSLDPSHPVASRRFGMMALDRGVFDVAVDYLARAHQREPENQATLKSLGYAYLWTGRLDLAEDLLRRLDARGDLINELGTWRWWWGTQDRADLSAYAGEMLRRLQNEN